MWWNGSICSRVRREQPISFSADLTALWKAFLSEDVQLLKHTQIVQEHPLNRAVVDNLVNGWLYQDKTLWVKSIKIVFNHKSGNFEKLFTANLSSIWSTNLGFFFPQQLFCSYENFQNPSAGFVSPCIPSRPVRLTESWPTSLLNLPSSDVEMYWSFMDLKRLYD